MCSRVHASVSECVRERVQSCRRISAFKYAIRCILDVNECRTDTSMCDVHAECINTEGSHRCECSYGYSGDGDTCTKTCGKHSKDLAPYRPNIIPGNNDYACQGGLSMLAYMSLVDMQP